MECLKLRATSGVTPCSIKYKAGLTIYAIIRFFVLLLVVNSNQVASIKRLELTTSTACNLCQCQAGEYANDLVVCDGYIYSRDLTLQIEVFSLPHYINAIQLSNASQADFNRGAIRVPDDKTFTITMSNIKLAKMKEKSLTLLSPTSKLKMI